MTARPPLAQTTRVHRSPEDLERLAAVAFRQSLARIVARAVSVVFGAIAVAVIAATALEFVRARHRADVLADCRAVADQFPDPADRRALLAANPACGPVVDVTRSR